jgi:hypothetical protein
MALRVAITGATGFIGRRLVRALVSRGAEVTAFTRDPARARRTLSGEVKVYAWNPLEGPPPAGALEGIDGVVNLAGETIGTPRWTNAQKRRIRQSRIVGTRNLVDGLAAAGVRPKVLVSGSGIDYYGDRGDERVDESSPPGQGFLARVVVDWEAEADRATSLGVRVVLVRTSLVLGPNGGILQQLLLPFRLGLGTTIGSGRQWMPWIHLEDEVGLILHALEAPEVSGPLNATAPNPATNTDFTRALARALGRPAFFVVPAFLVELAMGEASELLLASKRAHPTLALATGYTFVHPDLAGALGACL